MHVNQVLTLLHIFNPTFFFLFFLVKREIYKVINGEVVAMNLKEYKPVASELNILSNTSLYGKFNTTKSSSDNLRYAYFFHMAII